MDNYTQILYQDKKLLDACNKLKKLKEIIEKENNKEIIEKLNKTYEYIYDLGIKIQKEIKEKHKIDVEYKIQEINFNQEYKIIFYYIDVMMYEAIVTMSGIKGFNEIVQNTNINIYKPEELMVDCRELLNK